MKPNNRYWPLFFLLILAACGGGNYYSRQNLSYLYRADDTGFHPEYSFFHLSDSLSEFWFSIPSAELTYARPAESLPSSTRARLSVRVYVTGYPSVLRDTATISIITTGTGKNGYITGVFDLKTFGEDLTAEVNLWDLNKGTGNRQFMRFRRTGKTDPENFLVTDTSGIPVFNNWLPVSLARADIRYGRAIGEAIHVSYLEQDFPLPPAPFSLGPVPAFSFRPDSTFVLPVTDSVFTFQPGKPGIYHFRPDTSRIEGLTLVVPSGHFPRVTSTTELLGPLRYLSTREEFSKMESAGDVKQAVDEFWLKAGGSPERARQLIRQYYTRVSYANLYFSSYLEGWKTDRGMMYIIFGPPDVVYRYPESEVWVYGEDNNMMSMKLSFMKVKNPYSANDYSLERSELFRVFWYRAVEGWREGRIY